MLVNSRPPTPFCCIQCSAVVAESEIRRETLEPSGKQRLRPDRMPRALRRWRAAPQASQRYQPHASKAPVFWHRVWPTQVHITYLRKVCRSKKAPKARLFAPPLACPGSPDSRDLTSQHQTTESTGSKDVTFRVIRVPFTGCQARPLTSPSIRPGARCFRFCRPRCTRPCLELGV